MQAPLHTLQTASDAVQWLRTRVTGAPVSYTHLTLPTTPYV